MLYSELVDKLNQEVERLRFNYGIKSVANLEIIEKIAHEEFYVSHIVNTRLVNERCKVISDGDEFVIFYSVIFKPFKPLVVGHEVGHLACLRLGGENLHPAEEEDMATYFSARLNGVSRNQFKAYEFVDDLLITCRDVLNFLGTFKERERIERMGLAHLL